MFLIAYLLADLVFFAIGFCLLVSPGTYFALLDRMARTDFWAKRGPDWDPNAPKWRAAGIALTAFAVFMVVGPPLSAYLRSPGEFNQLVHSSHRNMSWGAIAVFLVFFVLGIGFLAKPLILLDKFSPGQPSAEAAVQQHAYKLRIFGGIMLFVSLFGIVVQLLRHFRQ